MDNLDFVFEIERVINEIAEIIDQNDKEARFDIDLGDGILTLGCEYGTYVINKQTATREIWLSSPISGPYHFAFLNNKWQSRSGVELFQILTNELGIAINELV